jgi:hypothetical protein
MNKAFRFALASVLVACSTATPALAESKSAPAKAPAKTQLLWNSWYTMTVNGKIPFGYYNDRVERKDGKIAYQNQLWKQEEGFINEERIVSFAKDDESLTPLLFNCVQTYRNNEIVIDGNFKGHSLTAKIRRNGKNEPSIQSSLPTKAFLSTLFQVWIGKRLEGMSPGKSVSFTTLFEDGGDASFSPIHGNVTLEKEDAFSKKTSTKKLSVELSGVKSTWYVLPSGESIRIEKPDQKLVIEKSSEADAKRSLAPRVDSAE